MFQGHYEKFRVVSQFWINVLTEAAKSRWYWCILLESGKYPVQFSCHLILRQRICCWLFYGGYHLYKTGANRYSNTLSVSVPALDLEDSTAILSRLSLYKSISWPYPLTWILALTAEFLNVRQTFFFIGLKNFRALGAFDKWCLN